MLKTLAVSTLVVVGVLLVLFLGAFIFLRLAPVFGGKPDINSQQKIAASSHFNGAVFTNRIITRLETRTEQSPSSVEIIKSLFLPPADKNPQQPLPGKSIKNLKLTNGDMAWLGHSTVIFKTHDITVVTDPVFYRASPIPIGGAPFKLANPLSSHDLPALDVVIISHDHYDHLDMPTIREVHERVKQFLVPLGIKAHLQRWGVDSEKIIELDWYESVDHQGVEFTLTPARHFSGRSFSDRDKTLWGSWVVRSPELRLYFSGDGGYSPDFKEIGDKYGPFDIALMENGAYDPDWAEIHMFPEETVRASQDLRAEQLLPIHWGKFDLALHHWRDPIERLMLAAKTENIKLVTPLVGEVFTLDAAPQHQWWLSNLSADTIHAQQANSFANEVSTN